MIRAYPPIISTPSGKFRTAGAQVFYPPFQKLKEKAGLLNVVFHSLRHSFTTYKLMLSKGDIKSVQGDTGHAKADMVTRVFAHVLDENQKENAKVSQL